jgi:hypothetical protein
MFALLDEVRDSRRLEEKYGGSDRGYIIRIGV